MKRKKTAKKDKQVPKKRQTAPKQARDEAAQQEPLEQHVSALLELPSHTTSHLRQQTVLQLQQRYGNSFVQNLLAKKKKNRADESDKNRLKNTERPVNQIQRAPGEWVRPIIRVWKKAPIGWGILPPSGRREERESKVYFKKGTDLKLIKSEGNWLQVRGDNAYKKDDDKQYGATGGWIRKDLTDLAQTSDAKTENDRVAQDLDDLLDAHILPSLDAWEEGLRTQGNAYLTAHNNFNDAITAADKQAKVRADWFAAILTTVSAGALGWLGEVAENSENLTKLLSDATRGSIEDALQTGIGEVIDIDQGGWFTKHIINETHPLRYLNSNIIQLVALRKELRSHVGLTKQEIRRSATAVNRAAVLVELYKYWNTTRARQIPKTGGSDEAAMAIEFERGFWQKYILEDLYRIRVMRSGHIKDHFSHTEDAINDRLDEIGIKDMAEIKEWSSWYEKVDYRGKSSSRTGSYSTIFLRHWAKHYKPETFD